MNFEYISDDEVLNLYNEIIEELEKRKIMPSCRPSYCRHGY
jgi:hypothetical protein